VILETCQHHNQAAVSIIRDSLFFVGETFSKDFLLHPRAKYIEQILGKEKLADLGADLGEGKS